MKKPTNVDRVMQLAHKKADGFTSGEAHTVCKDAGKNTVGALLWNLKKKGVLVHDRATGIYKLAEDRKLTPVNNLPADEPQEEADRKKWKMLIKAAATEATNAGMQKVMENYNALTQQHNTLREQYQDALAIIRYLENKLYIVIQQQAKNGNA